MQPPRVKPGTVDSTAHRLFELSASPNDTGATPPPRKEIKFVYSGSDLGKLRSVLEVNCRRQSFQGNVSRVSSLYFDSVSLKDCADSIHGVGERAKVRLRWYDAPFPSPVCFLEIKRRRHRITEKSRIGLRTLASIEDAALSQIHDGLAWELSGMPALALANRPAATALVEYDREHFEDPATGIRLTLDYNIVSYAQIGGMRLRREFPDQFEDVIVLEAKAPPSGFGELSRVLYPLRPHVARFSKYVVACQSMGGFSGALAGRAT